MNISAQGLDFQQLNERIRADREHEITLDGVNGQRFIASGLKDKNIRIHGIPGNALGSYLDGSRIEVFGNAQDATGDTMNDGCIIIHGNSGDGIGYAMRGGKIYIEGNTGYRTGIHMKEYKQKFPVIVVGGEAGSFLGEYQAGGLIVVLGLNTQPGLSPVGNFCGAGIHGGCIFLRCTKLPPHLPEQVSASVAQAEDLEKIQPYLREFCQIFGKDSGAIMRDQFFMLSPNTKNPYKQLYTPN